MLPVRLDPLAIDDLREAYDWYERQRAGQGLEFTHDVNVTIGVIRRMPASFAEFEPEVRRVRCQRFPYHVYYSIEATEIAILAVYHDRRDPSRWRDRS